MPEPYRPQIYLPKEDDDVRALSALASMAKVPWQDRDKTEEREHAELVRDERRAYNKKLLADKRIYIEDKGDYAQAVTDEENQLKYILENYIGPSGLHEGLGMDDLDRGIAVYDARNKEYETWYGDEDKQIFTEEGDRIIADEALRFISLSNNMKNILLNHKSMLATQLDKDAALVTSLADLAVHNKGFLKTEGGHTFYDIEQTPGPELANLMREVRESHAIRDKSGLGAFTQEQIIGMDDNMLAAKFIAFEQELNPTRTRKVNGQIENYQDIVWNPNTLEYNVPASWGPQAKQSINNAYRFFKVEDMVNAYQSISNATIEKATFEGAQIRALTKVPTPKDVVHERDTYIINKLNNIASGTEIITPGDLGNPELNQHLTKLRTLTMGKEDKDFESVLGTAGNVVRKTFGYLFKTTLFEQDELPIWFQEDEGALKETGSHNLPYFVKWHLGLISMDYEADGETAKRTKDGQPKFTTNTDAESIKRLRQQRLERYDYVKDFDIPMVGEDHSDKQADGVLAVGKLLEYYNTAYDHNMARPALLLGTGVQNLQQYLNVVGVKPNLNPGNLLDSLNTAALDTTVLDTGVIDTSKSAALVDTNNVPITVTPPDSNQQVLTSLDSLTAVSTSDPDSLLKLADDLRDSSDVSDERDSSLIELSNVIGDTTKDDTFKANIFDYVSEGEMKAVWDSLTDKQKKMYGGDYSSFVSGRQAGFTNMVAYNKIDPDTLTKIEDKGKGALLEQAQGSKWKDVQPRHSFGTGNAIKKYSKTWDQDATGRSSHAKKRPEGINTKEEWVLWKMLSQKGFGKIESKDIREQILFAEKAKKQDPSIELLFDVKTYNELEEKVLKIISKTKKK